MNNADNLGDAWESLGVAFLQNSAKTLNADPERTLLQSLCNFTNDRKLFHLTLAWLFEFADLIHVERLKSLSQKLTPIELAWLGGISALMCDPIFYGDLRFKSLQNSIEKRLGIPRPEFPTSALDKAFIKRDGNAHPAFLLFGISLAQSQVVTSDSKKIRPRDSVLRSNLWLRLRALMGTNWRADVATTMLLKLADKPYQAQKVLGCSSETAIRNWRALEEARVNELSFA